MTREDQKLREQQAAEAFLHEYNRETGKNLRIKSRPEEDYSVDGSFDFLCVDDGSGEEIALEIAELQESQERRESDEFLGDLLVKVEDDLEGYVDGTFLLVVYGRVLFKEEDYETLLKVIKDCSKPLKKDEAVSVKKPLLCVLKKISDDGSIVGFMFGYKYTGNPAIDADIQRLIGIYISYIIPKKNQQLASAGDRETFLLLDNRQRHSFFATPRNIAKAIEKLEPIDHNSIGHIYLIDDQIREIELRRQM